MAKKKTGRKEKDFGSESLDLEKILEEKEKLDNLLEKKFKKVITVMFTDLKDSTAIAEEEGDMAVRALLKKHNDIVFPIIEQNSGNLVKTMGDGTMSYFEKAQDAVRTAIGIQRGIDKYNGMEATSLPMLIRVGIHTGKGIVEKNDIFGDVVNVASRFESLAEAGEIYLSEKTFEVLEDKDELICRFIKTSELKGKKGTFKVYKAYWKNEEIEKARLSPTGDIILNESSTSSIFIPRDMVEFEKTSLEVAEESAAIGPSLVIEKTDKTRQTIPIADDEMVIGRTDECNVKFEDNFISRRHARIFTKNGAIHLQDLGSHIGTALNGKNITGEEPLKNGDEISLGSIRITFVNPLEGVESDGEVSQDEITTMAMTSKRHFKLVVLSENREISEYPLQEERSTIGRLPTCSIQIDDQSVSRNHARIWINGDDVCLEDCGSNNGTFINGKIMESNKTVKIGENRQFIINKFRFMVLDATKTANVSLFGGGTSILAKVKGLFGKS